MFRTTIYFVLCLSLSLANEFDYPKLGRPCRVNHCGDQHVCVRRKAATFQYRCVPKSYLKDHLEKITEWNLNPMLVDEFVQNHSCSSCLSESLNYTCGTDGRVYRSPCYIEFFNCLFNLQIEVDCYKECPCHEEDLIEEIPHEETKKIIDPLDDESPNDSRGYFDQCSRSIHRSLRNRFFDWFHQMVNYEDDQSLIVVDQCHPVVQSMFNRLDVTNDSQLNQDELDSIEHLRDEICTDQFFKRCDTDNDQRLFLWEWCPCFDHALLPCDSHNEELDQLFWNQSMEEIFRPRCASSGYYATRQCNSATPRQCWCVDRHGNEVEGTRNDDDHMPQCA